MLSKAVVASAGAAVLLFSVSAGADRGHAQGYPSQQIKLVVPFAPGGLTDLLGRLAAEQIKAKTGQTVIVENRSGAGGNTGLAQVAQSQADGYTIALAGVTSFTVNPLIYKAMPLNPMKELVPAGALAETPLVLTTNAKALPYATLKGFIAHVKQHPGKYNFGSSGTGTPAHILVDHVLRQAGLTVQHVVISRHRPGDHRHVVGQRADRRCVAGAGRRTCAGRHIPADRGAFAQAPAVPARRADHRGGRAAPLRCDRLVGHRRARRNAQARDRSPRRDLSRHGRRPRDPRRDCSRSICCPSR